MSHLKAGVKVPAAHLTDEQQCAEGKKDSPGRTGGQRIFSLRGKISLWKQAEYGNRGSSNIHWVSELAPGQGHPESQIDRSQNTLFITN